MKKLSWIVVLQLIRKKTGIIFAKFFILIDNLRYDQWKVLEDKLSKYFFIKEEKPFMSILPTTTEFSRNSIFSGLTPYQMNKDEFDLWSDKSNGLNNNEYYFLDNNFKNFTHYINVIEETVVDKVPVGLSPAKFKQINGKMMYYISIFLTIIPH